MYFGNLKEKYFEKKQFNKEFLKNEQQKKLRYWSFGLLGGHN